MANASAFISDPPTSIFVAEIVAAVTVPVNVVPVLRAYDDKLVMVA